MACTGFEKIIESPKLCQQQTAANFVQAEIVAKIDNVVRIGAALVSIEGHGGHAVRTQPLQSGGEAGIVGDNGPAFATRHILVGEKTETPAPAPGAADPAVQPRNQSMGAIFDHDEVVLPAQ